MSPWLLAIVPIAVVAIAARGPSRDPTHLGRHAAKRLRELEEHMDRFRKLAKKAKR